MHPHGMLRIGLFLGIVAMIAAPQSTAQATQAGLSLWFSLLVPAMIPIILLLEWFHAYGIIAVLSNLCEPLMRRWFQLPGCGAIVVIVGFLSGYPLAAQCCIELVQQQKLSRSQAWRLIAFSTTADPLFVLSVVAIGLYHRPGLAIPLFLAHYGSAVLLGLWAARKTKEPPIIGEQPPAHPMSWFVTMHRARDHRTFAEATRDGLWKASKLLSLIAGLVVLSTVLCTLIAQTPIVQSWARWLNASGMVWLSPLLQGMSELTLGLITTASTTALPLSLRLAITSFLLAWGGLAVHAQVMTVASSLRMGYLSFVRARLLHGFLATAFTLLLGRWFV